MEVNRQKMNMASEWNVKPASKEFANLPEDVLQSISSYLGGYPVRLGSIAKQLGIKVLLSTMPRGTSGQIGQEAEGFVIRINRHESKQRQRFTLAHEIAHFLLHREKIVASGGWSENVLLRSGQPAQIEFEANRLASDLIIPSHLLKEVLGEYKGPMTSEIIEDLALKFGVSVAAMEIKLQMA